MRTTFNYLVKSEVYTRKSGLQKNSQNDEFAAKLQFKSIYKNKEIPFFATIANSKTPLRFKGRLTGADFIKWIEKEEIQAEKLAEIVLKAGKYIGEGSSNVVYEIPNNPQFILRIPKTGTIPGKVEIIEDEFPELNIGQAIARIGNIRINKKQTGIPAGIPYKDRLEAPSFQNILTYRKHIHRTAQMPQEAYDDLAETFKLLNDRDYSFDMYNPNNLHVDFDEKKFKLVDDLNEIYTEKDKNTFASIAIPLFDTWFARCLSYTEDLVESWRQILEKSIKAGKKANLPEPQKDIHTINEIFNYAGMDKYK